MDNVLLKAWLLVLLDIAVMAGLVYLLWEI